MLFNTIGFAIFLTIVFFLYWFVANKNLIVQNSLLLISSYYFYSCWDWRFLFLLIFSTLLDYFTGIKMSKSNKKVSKKFWFWLSILINLGFYILLSKAVGFIFGSNFSFYFNKTFTFRSNFST